MRIPKYAAGTPRDKLVQILCKGTCGRMRYAAVSKVPWSSDGARPGPELFATCLKCGRQARDNYNWIRV